MPVSEKPRDTTPRRIMQHTPKKGSFWDGKVGMHTTKYVQAEDDPNLCIGEINRVARNRLRWGRYDKPVKADTVRKHRPTFAETHVVGSVSQALWALDHSYKNALKT